MGCGASVVPAATEEQKKEMMTFALKEMMIDIGTTAITKGAEVKVKAPLDHVGKIREFVKKTREAGTKAKESMSSAGGAEDKAKEVAKSGGMMAGVAAMGAGAAKALDKGLAAAGGAAGEVAEKALNACADGMQAGIDKLDEEFAAVGKEVTEKKKDDIIEAYKGAINDKTIEQPQVLVRGANPHGPKEAGECAKDAASAYITNEAKSELVEKLGKACGDAVKESAACKGWKAVIDNYNKANEELGKVEALKSFKQDPIELDIEKYIVEQIILGYKSLMATKELANRANPKSVAVPKNPTTFEICWNIGEGGIPYGEFKKNHYDDFKFNNK